MGALPLYAAKWSLSAKRPTSRVRPTVMAAITGPTPKTLVVGGPRSGGTKYEEACWGPPR